MVECGQVKACNILSQLLVIGMRHQKFYLKPWNLRHVACH